MDIVAHRGARKRALENTLDALRIAYEEGADGVEFDVQRSVDGELVLFHDDDLYAMSGRRERVVDLPWRQLRGLELHDSAGHRGLMPHLDDVLELLADRKGLRNLELKVVGDEGAALAEAVAAKLASFSAVVGVGGAGLVMPASAGAPSGGAAPGDARGLLVASAITAGPVQSAGSAGAAGRNAGWWVSSFDRAALVRFAAAGTGLPIGALVDEVGGDFDALRSASADGLVAFGAAAQAIGHSFAAVHPHHGDVDAARVAHWRMAGLRIHTWTVNTPSRWRSLAGLGVDAVITDEPGTMRKWQERAAERP